MEIREYRQYDEREILLLYASVGWTAYTDQPETLRRGFENSLLTLAAYEENRLIGILRAVGDGPTITYAGPAVDAGATIGREIVPVTDQRTTTRPTRAATTSSMLRSTSPRGSRSAAERRMVLGLRK